MLLRPGEPPITNETTTTRQRRMARQPSSDATETQDAKAANTALPAIQERSEAKKPNRSEIVLALLNREGGATLDELIEVTGWLPHSTRAALTGLKKKGHAIERTKAKGISRYAIVEPVSQ